MHYYQNTKKLSTLTALLMGTLIVSGCNNTGGSSGNGTTEPDVVTDIVRPVFLDALGVLPVANQSEAYLLRINNVSNESYTLESVSVSDAALKDGAKMVGVSADMCGTLTANSSCSIQITPKTGGKSADALLTVKMRNSQGKMTVLHQIIRMSNKVVNDNGGIHLKNDIANVVTPDGNYGISIPVMLTEDYDDIKPTNGSLLCSTAGFKRGNSCTITIKGKAMADNSIIATELTGYRSGKAVETSGGSSMIKISTKADLLISHGIELKANGKSGASIAVFNDGQTPATAITEALDANSKLTIVNKGDCATGELAAGSLCTYQITAKSEINGSDLFALNYDDGVVLSRQAAKVATTVNYFGEDPSIDLKITTGDKLLHTLTQTGDKQEIIVTNNGNRTLTGLKLNFGNRSEFKLTPAAFTDSSGTTEACTNDLNAGDSCAMELVYTPTVEQTADSLRISASGSYQDSANTTQQLYQTFGVAYSADDIAKVNFLEITTQGQENLTVLANSSATTSADYRISNTSQKRKGYATTLKGLPEALEGTNTTAVAGTSIALANTDCTDGKALAAGSSCGFQLQYGPIDPANAQKHTGVKLNQDYTIDLANGYSKTALSNDFTLEAKVHGAVINVSFRGMTDGTAPLTGIGTVGDPYFFTALTSNRAIMTYYIINNGNAPASKFKIGQLPSGVEIHNNTDCAYGTQAGKELAANNSCTLMTITPTSSFLENNPIHTSNDATMFGNITLPLTYSFDDEWHQDMTKYISFSRNWAQAGYTVEPIVTQAHQYVLTINATATPIEAWMLPITFDAVKAANNALAGATIRSCTINNPGDSCPVEIIFPMDSVVEGDELDVHLTASPVGNHNMDKISSKVSVTIPTDPVIVPDNHFNQVKPLVTAPDGSSFNLNGQAVAVTLPDGLPLTPDGEAAQVVNSFLLANNTSQVLIQTNGTGNNLLIAPTNGQTATPVDFAGATINSHTIVTVRNETLSKQPIVTIDNGRPGPNRIYVIKSNGTAKQIGSDVPSPNIDIMLVSDNRIYVRGTPMQRILRSTDEAEWEIIEGKNGDFMGGSPYVTKLFTAGNDLLLYVQQGTHIYRSKAHTGEWKKFTKTSKRLIAEGGRHLYANAKKKVWKLNPDGNWDEIGSAAHITISGVSITTEKGSVLWMISAAMLDIYDSTTKEWSKNDSIYIAWLHTFAKPAHYAETRTGAMIIGSTERSGARSNNGLLYASKTGKMQRLATWPETESPGYALHTSAADGNTYLKTKLVEDSVKPIVYVVEIDNSGIAKLVKTAYKELPR